MIVKTTLGFSVEVNDDNGSFLLPQRHYTTAELKKIARDINRDMRQKHTTQLLGEVQFYE